MDPSTWQTPFIITFAGLFCIVFLRAGATYALGRGVAAGTALTRWRKFLDSRGYRIAERWLDRWGMFAVTASFLTIGLQTAIQLGAGVMRMPLRRYFPALAMGSVIWALMYSTVGFIGFVAILQLWLLSPALAILVGALLVAAIVWAIKRKPRAAVITAEDQTPA